MLLRRVRQIGLAALRHGAPPRRTARAQADAGRFDPRGNIFAPPGHGRRRPTPYAPSAGLTWSISQFGRDEHARALQRSRLCWCRGEDSMTSTKDIVRSGRDAVSRRRFLTAASTGIAGTVVAGRAVADTLADVPPREPGADLGGPSERSKYVPNSRIPPA